MGYHMAPPAPQTTIFSALSNRGAGGAILHTAPSSENKRYNKEHDKDKEQRLGDGRRPCRDPEESKDPRNDRNDQKDNCPA